MSLSSIQLDAFAAVAKFGSFSIAANSLHVTQSALSQRIMNLESDLGITLFLRETKQIRLTEFGQKLLRYCRSREKLEEEVLLDLMAGSKKEVHGQIGVASFSTITRSLLMPCISDILKKHSHAKIDLFICELHEMQARLSSGAADFIFTNSQARKAGIKSHLLGNEEYVLIQSKKNNSRNIFIDHDENDSTTEDFFKNQASSPKGWARGYLNDIYSIIDAVRLGMGKAVVPLHLIHEQGGIEIVSQFKPLKVPVFLQYFEQSYYSHLQVVFIESLQKQFPILLKGK